MTLEELKNSGKPTLAESDPHFMPSQSYRGTPDQKRTPTSDDLNSIPSAEKHNPSIKPVDTGKVDLNNMQPMDIDSLPKRAPEENKIEQAMMADLEAAVERECESITERTDAITQKQYEEFLEEQAAKAQADPMRDIGKLDDDTDSSDIVATNGDMEYNPDDDLDFAVEYDTPTQNDDVKIIHPGEEEHIKATVDPIYTANNEDVPPPKAVVDPIITHVDEEEPTIEGVVDHTFKASNDEIPSFTATADDTTVISKEGFPLRADVAGDGSIEDAPVVNTADGEEDSDNSFDFDLLSDAGSQLSSELGNEDPDEDDEEEQREMYESLREQVKEIISPVKNRIDFSKFNVSKTPMAASKAIRFSVDDVNKADWVLPYTEKRISCTGLSGPEIISMNPDAQGSRSKINHMKDVFSIVYRHITDKNKGSFEHWMKTTKYTDIPHLYFGLYRATFSTSNFNYYTCPNPRCKRKAFIRDVAFKDMVRYKSPEIEKKMNDILEGVYSGKPSYPVKRIQISDRYVVDVKEPSIWNVAIELQALSDDFLEKYQQFVDLVSFINNVYVIDYENMSLNPIDTNPDRSSLVKTIANKINVYADVLRNIPTDSYTDFRMQIAELFRDGDDEDLITYWVPETTCPYCNTKVDEEQHDPRELLFTRHQLGLLGSTRTIAR